MAECREYSHVISTIDLGDEFASIFNMSHTRSRSIYHLHHPSMQRHPIWTGVTKPYRLNDWTKNLHLAILASYSSLSKRRTAIQNLLKIPFFKMKQSVIGADSASSTRNIKSPSKFNSYRTSHVHQHL